MSTHWPPRDRPPQNLKPMLKAFMEQHPVPDAIHFMFLRHYHVRHPLYPDPDADPTRSGQWEPISVLDHCFQVLLGYYQQSGTWTRTELSESLGMPAEYIEALERYLGVELPVEEAKGT